MRCHCLAVLIALVGVVLLVPVGVASQSRTADASGWSSSRTPWGDPDLQGTWTNTTTTPLQRPADLAEHQLLTDEERAERDEARDRSRETRRPGQTGSYNNFWLERGSLATRPSLIVNPQDGRLPSVTPAAQQRADALAARRDSASYPTTWDEPSVFERCITRGMPATMMPGFYNHLDALDADRRDNADKAFGFGSDIERAYNQFWYDYGTTLTEDKRTSLIIDPPDGKIPWTPEGRNRPGTFATAFSGMITAGPEDRALSERCILGFNSGPPMNPSAYNNNVQLFQTPDAVVILNEMVHNARIVPLDGQPHLSEDVRQWVGDSRGHWEGEDAGRRDDQLPARNQLHRLECELAPGRTVHAG